LQQYVVEDIIFIDPTTQERLLICVSITHELFAMTWLPTYKLQEVLRLPIMFDKETFFQIEAVVVKKLKRQDCIDGVVNEDDAK
jgi:hypothetical protein